jgi:hypothetical protein
LGQIAKALHDALPGVDEGCFVYVMAMNLVAPASRDANPKNRKLHNPQDSQRCFGFLSRKKIPEVR